MKLIADIGSTKSSWAWIKSDGSVKRFEAIGFNPNYQSSEEIKEVIATVLDQIDLNSSYAIYLYGAGIDSPKSMDTIARALAILKIDHGKTHIHSDLLAAAQAAYRKRSGLIGILGTGSNISYYNGESISPTLSLGYMVTDEGGGVHLGKEFIKAYLYGKLNAEIMQEVSKEHTLTKEHIIHQLYFEEYPQKYLASFAPLLLKYREEKAIRKILNTCFDSFFDGPASVYKAQSSEIKLIGSIALNFQDIIRERAELYGFEISEIIQNPLEGLIDYHLEY